MDDTVVVFDAPAVGYGWVRAVMPVLVDGEITLHEVDYQMPSPRRDYNDMDYLRRSFEERSERSWAYYVQDRASVLESPPAATTPPSGGLREVRAGDAGMPEECAVCLQDFDASAKEALRVMPSCSHAFHPDCILSWLRVKAVCPMCRQAMPTQQDKDKDSEDEDDSDEDSDEDDTDSDEDDTDAVDYQLESTPAVPDPEEP